MKRIICFLMGHEWKEIRTFFGKLDNGKPVYVQSFGDCERCGKKK